MKSAKDEWYAEEGLAFSCERCGNCCTGPSGYVWFNDDEAITMAKFLDLDLAVFLRRHAHKVNGRWSLNERWNEVVRGYDCVFLARDENGLACCTINQAKPTQCRTWPFWPENLKTEKAWRRTSEGCPGVDKGKIVPVEQIRIIRDSNPWAKR